ncbi:hypothetical protein MOQ72_41930 [Saccharopolyspora sp. K220]|uniref:hypothetical protein n=1 Tax=Saccharopolyspora soli TaxID=2926618 RepID=UPI001F58BA0B|nr:hypothetical protein [Saccharopolyspora soli]MCI2423979.1 hypothetical protein [Saccharopolyspora soli]
MVQDVGFWGAVGLWWDGQKLENFTMYGWPMLYWARLGKYLQFIGGALVVLDLIGAERIRNWSENIKKLGLVVVDRIAALITPRRIVGVIKTLGFVAGAILTGLIINPGISLLLAIVSLILPPLLAFLFALQFGFIVCLAWLVGLGKHGHAAKWVAFFLLTVGFHLDLLGS